MKHHLGTFPYFDIVCLEPRTDPFVFALRKGFYVKPSLLYTMMSLALAILMKYHLLKTLLFCEVTARKINYELFPNVTWFVFPYWTDTRTRTDSFVLSQRYYVRNQRSFFFLTQWRALIANTSVSDIGEITLTVDFVILWSHS